MGVKSGQNVSFLPDPRRGMLVVQIPARYQTDVNAPYD